MANTKTYQLWEKLSGVPVVGKHAFSVAVSLTAPYFRTVLPHLAQMRPGYAKATMPKWWGVQNHIGSVHAIAACNLAEFAMGMLCEATVPTTHRWVPKGMTTEYLRISKGGLTAEATAEVPDFAAITPTTGGVDFPVTITLTDSEDDGVNRHD